MYQTGVWSTGSPRAARRNALSWTLLMSQMLALDPACTHIGRRTPAYCDLMVVGSEARPGSGAPPSPPEFQEAVRAMSEARMRPEVLCEPMPAPQRIAPYAAALSADVTVDGEDLSTGRIILLHDPAGNDSWDGT